MSELMQEIPSQAVHLCIDMQRIFLPDGPWPAPWMERVLPNVIDLVGCAPERTVFTRFITPQRPSDLPGTWATFYKKWRETTRERLDPRLLNLLPELERFAPPAGILDKRVYSAFADGRLHSELRGRGSDTLIVSGVEAEVCVLASVLAAVDYGYRVIVAEDAVCSASDEAHEAMFSLYRRRFDIQIEIADTNAIIDHWRV